MPSGKHNSITAKATGLISSLFDITSSQDVPFGIPHAVHTVHAPWTYLTFVLICVPFLFADSPKLSIHSSVMHGFPTFVNRNRPYLMW